MLSGFALISVPSVALTPNTVAYESTEVVMVAPAEPLCDEVTDMRCNCYLYVRATYPAFPLTKDLQPNTYAHVGAVAIFDYPHYGIITALEERGYWVRDSNWGGPGHREHFMLWDNPHLIGFWAPGDGP